MTEFNDDPGLLGRAKSGAEQATELDETSRALVSLIDGGSTADAVEFAQGAIDAVCTICAALIGRGLVEPTAFQDDVRRYADAWRNKDRPNRALASDIVLARLQTIERTKRRATAHLLRPDSPRVN
jgi:hypothetical protein